MKKILKNFLVPYAKLVSIVGVLILFSANITIQAYGLDLPVIVPQLPKVKGGIRNQVTFEQIHNIIGPEEDGEGLVVDLQDPTLMGKIYTGPYPFEAGNADYDYARYRKSSNLEFGKGTLRISDFFENKYNSNDWPDGLNPFSTKSIAYRLDLWKLEDDGRVSHLGFYDSIVAFEKSGDTIQKNLTIVEGPFVALVRSESPRTIWIVWETDEPSTGTVLIYGKRSGAQVGEYSDGKFQKRHEVKVSGLRPSREYMYVVQSQNSTGEIVTSEFYHFKTAPRSGKGTIRFAYTGDSREGVGGGERNYMGCNFKILSQIAMNAYRQGADFFVFGGDLINGYTSDPADFRLQLRGWKQAMAGFWREHAVYTGMGNHESLLNVYDNNGNRICLDKWPYKINSAEAIFAKEFLNPRNGLRPADPRRPSYKENVYTFKYGSVQIVAFNNNYWYTSNSQVPYYGGSPEGYILEDQLEWLENTLKKAEKDRKVKYVFLFAQEPVFPCGGHIKDAMWWHGNNNIRAYSRKGDEVIPEKLGMIEVRNRFWEAVSSCSKVAAVLTSDEHEYHRTLITSRTPVGVYPKDDTDGDGILDKYSPDRKFKYPTWHITVGTAGAPYYSREETPWQPVVLSSQEGYALIEAFKNRVSLKFISITGQVVDKVANLMAVKKMK